VQIATFPTAELAAAHVAGLVVDLLRGRPDAVLGLPAGNTPLPVYTELIRRRRAGEVSFARARAFILDEYLGLPPDHPATFRRMTSEAFFDHVDFQAGYARAPEIGAGDPKLEATHYEARIVAAGGLDLALLGIGSNGHIAFNEPGATFDSRSRVITLADDTRRALLPSFGAEPVPTQAITMGIGTILDARRCVLIAFGAGKADIVARAIEGPATAQVPASSLQIHPDALVVLDEAAASRLTPSQP